MVRILYFVNITRHNELSMPVPFFTAPLLGAAMGLLYVSMRHGVSLADIWRTSSVGYKVFTLGSVFLSAALLTLIQPT